VVVLIIFPSMGTHSDFLKACRGYIGPNFLGRSAVFMLHLKVSTRAVDAGKRR
jgi:hypothetical protein